MVVMACAVARGGWDKLGGDTMVAVRWLTAEMETDTMVGATGEDKVGACGRKNNCRWWHR